MRSLILASSLLFALNAQAQVHEASPIARIAIEQALGAYGKGGMTAIQLLSQDCYKRDLDKIYCIYLDTAAQQIDAPIADGLKLPRDSYFLGDAFLERVGPILIGAGLNMDESNTFLSKCYEEVSNANIRAASKAAVGAGG